MHSTTQGSVIHAVIASFCLIFTIFLAFFAILFMGILKIFPHPFWQNMCTRYIDSVITAWCGFNNFYINTTQKIDWKIEDLDNIDYKKCYLIIANHQSWLDVVVLQYLFNDKIPILKFFVKDSLKWVPFFGFAWWAMGCPFMKRYSKEYLLKNPHKQGQDLLATLNAVTKLKRTPSSIVNFVEGTRYNEQKKEKQNSPYVHLLKPKAGGVSVAISALGGDLTGLLDVTIVYPKQQHSLWGFLCNRIGSIKVHIRQLPIPVQFYSSAQLINDPLAQSDFKDWLNQKWAEKDRLITSLKES